VPCNVISTTISYISSICDLLQVVCIFYMFSILYLRTDSRMLENCNFVNWYKVPKFNITSVYCSFIVNECNFYKLILMFIATFYNISVISWHEQT
jgi:hypothetical protein